MSTRLVLHSARLLAPGAGAFLPGSALDVGEDGRIAALGDDRRIRELAGAATVVDLKGAVVAPGLVDGHLHPVTGAELTGGLDLSGCADLAGVREALAREVRKLSCIDWLFAWGRDPNVFGDEPAGIAPPRHRPRRRPRLPAALRRALRARLPPRPRTRRHRRPAHLRPGVRRVRGGALWRVAGVKLFVTPPPPEGGGFSLCRLGVATDQPGP